MNPDFLDIMEPLTFFEDVLPVVYYVNIDEFN